MEVDEAERVLAPVLPENNANVLFEPDQQHEFEDTMNENATDQTVIGHSGKLGGELVTDDKLLTAQRVRCCICGIMTLPNAANTCINCLKSKIDVTEGISKSQVLHHCRECNRYQRTPWTACELESAELLSLCLKKIAGLKQVKLLDAAFVWTEPHSRRIKIRLTV